MEQLNDDEFYEKVSSLIHSILEQKNDSIAIADLFNDIATIVMDHIEDDPTPEMISPYFHGISIETTVDRLKKITPSALMIAIVRYLFRVEGIKPDMKRVTIFPVFAYRYGNSVLQVGKL